MAAAWGPSLCWAAVEEFLGLWLGATGETGLAPAAVGVFVRCSPGWAQEGWQPDEVVGGGGEGEGPADALDATVSGLSQARGLLDPAEDLLDALSNDLADGVAGMPRGAVVDRRAAPLAGLCWVVVAGGRRSGTIPGA